MRRMIITLRGLLALFMLAIKTRCRLRGPYWRWRYETAFGCDPDKHTTRRQRWRAMIEYGDWVHRMNKLSRR